MGLGDFCSAVFKRNPPVTSQAKFLQDLFLASGSTERIDDEYARKLFKGTKQISGPQYESFSNPVDKNRLHVFLQGHIKPASKTGLKLEQRCEEIAKKAGLPASLHIESDPFIWALTDWFDAIINDPENCDVLERAYRLRLKDEELEPRDSLPVPLYSGDRVDVLQPPTLQNHDVSFWQEFTHEWVLQNIGKIPWTGRTLVCVNPTDSHIRPVHSETVVIPDSQPGSGRIKIQCVFKTQGQEGQVASMWEMRNETGENCFPGSKTQFNVVADVAFPHYGGKK